MSATNFKSIEVAPAITRAITTGSFGATEIEVKWTPVLQVEEWTWVVFRHESTIPGDIFLSTTSAGKRSTTVVVPKGQALPGMLIAPGTNIYAFSSIQSRHLQIMQTAIPLAQVFGQLASVLANAICDTLAARRR